MYSHAVQETPSYSRMAAAALLAVSAGACVGVALSPAVSSLYAPAAVQPAIASRAAAMNVPRTQMQAVPVQYGAEQLVQVDAAIEGASSNVNASWAGVCGGVFAAAAAIVAIVYKGRAESSEQIAMLAAAGKKKAAAPKAAKRQASGERLLWYPTAEAPEWLDGSLPGDRGFDPLGLAKPTEFVQFDLDALDQNAAKNPAGKAIGRVSGNPDQLTGEAFAPYSEVFGLQRFRECELIHGRWAMLAALGCIVGEAVTGVAWQNAGLVESAGYTYFNNPLPFTGGQVVWFEVLTMGFVEVFRNTELNPERRLYPGGAFDPLGLAAANDEGTFRLKEAELKHGRLAMIAFLGFAIASARTGLGVTSAFSEFATGFN